MVADGGAVVHGDAACFVNKHAQGALRGEFVVHQLGAEAGEGGVSNALNVHVFFVCKGYKYKKMTARVIFRVGGEKLARLYGFLLEMKRMFCARQPETGGWRQPER